MSLLVVIIVLILVGLLMGAVNRYGKDWLGPGWLRLINAVAIIATIIWLLAMFGVWDYVDTIRLPR